MTVDYHKRNWGDKITCPVDTSEFISSATLILAQWDHNVVLVTRQGLCTGSVIWTSNMEVQSGFCPYRMPNLPTACRALGMASFPRWGGHSATWLYVLKHFQHGRSRAVFSNGIDTYSNLHFPPLCELVAQSYPTLCEPMDCSPPGSSAHGIFQARILEWVAMSFSRGSSQSRS